MSNKYTGNLITAIENGKYDDDLQMIAQAISNRLNQLSDGNPSVDFKEGQRLRIKRNANLRPKYMNGQEIIVRKVNRVRLKCDLVLGRGCRFDKNFSIGKDLVEPIRG